MIFSIILIPFLALAHVIQDDVTVTEKTRYSLKSVCSKSGHPDSPLIEVISGTTIDCMGRRIDAADFCDREHAADPFYLRAVLNADRQEVICVSGKKVIFRYLCVKLTDRALCSRSADYACGYIKGKLARRLDIVHAAFLKNEKGIQQLNCFFDSLSAGEKVGF
jgi:hypothetical protein